jgi:hypothetical protein
MLDFTRNSHNRDPPGGSNVVVSDLHPGSIVYMQRNQYWCHDASGAGVKMRFVVLRPTQLMFEQH